VALCLCGESSGTLVYARCWALILVAAHRVWVRGDGGKGRGGVTVIEAGVFKLDVKMSISEPVMELEGIWPR